VLVAGPALLALSTPKRPRHDHVQRDEREQDRRNPPEQAHPSGGERATPLGTAGLADRPRPGAALREHHAVAAHRSAAARAGARRLHREGWRGRTITLNTEPVRLLGVSVHNLEPRENEQLELFQERVREDKLGDTLDAITARFGRGAIRRAVDEPEKATHSDRKKRGE